MQKKLYYVSDEFLEKFRIEFNQKYLNYYKKLDYDSIKRIFDEPGVLIESDFEFDYTPLKLAGDRFFKLSHIILILSVVLPSNFNGV